MSFKIHTTTSVENKAFHATSGEVYTILSEAMTLSTGEVVSGPKQFMIRTNQLDKLVEIVTMARDGWKRAKEIEENVNKI